MKIDCCCGRVETIFFVLRSDEGFLYWFKDRGSCREGVFEQPGSKGMKVCYRPCDLTMLLSRTIIVKECWRSKEEGGREEIAGQGQ